MKILGPPNSDIVIITDFPSPEESASKNPLSDYAGGVFLKKLAQAGILVTNCQIVSLCDEAPGNGPTGFPDIEEWLSKRKTCPGPEWRHVNGAWVHPVLAKACQRLSERLAAVQPRLVIALGDATLWALTGHQGVTKWRGSRLSLPQWPFTILPMLHPRLLIRMPELGPLFQVDLKRAKNIYEGTQLPRNYDFIVAPTFQQVRDSLSLLLEKADSARDTGNILVISGDLETRGGHIACLGIADSATSAICIPFITVNDENPFYWTVEEETEIVQLIARLFMHPYVLSVGQNYLYDCQYYWRHWGFLPSNVRDTMIGHHAHYSNLRKGLDFLSSFYAHDHVYWKDEIKEWDAKIGERQYWIYNCKDACITWEIWPEIEGVSTSDDKWFSHQNFQQSLFFPVLRMMNRGIRVNTQLKGIRIGFNPDTEEEIWSGLKGELLTAQKARQEKLNYLVGHELNPKSPAQLSKFFYNDLGIPGVKNLAGDALTTNSPAMALIAEREPMLKAVCQLIVELRSLGVFLGTFIDAQLDSDGRMRCSFSIAGPITFRFSSSENAFGSGMNLQNIPVAEKAKIKDKDYIHLPNIRKLFIPDAGFTFFDIDLDRADLQVVIWEADDKDLKKALRLGLDMHCVNACDVFEIKGIPYDELREDHPNYREHRARIGEANRGKTKAGVHATNYGVGDRKLAQTLGITVHDAARFRGKWFGAHPGVRKWHLRTEQSITKRGYLENRFGARLYNFGRINLPEFLGWLPQSTVAGVINRALVKIDEHHQSGKTSIELLIQVHDSLAGQFRTERRAEEIATLKTLAEVVIPYEDPLIIPTGVKLSEVSWGDCK